MVRLAANYLSYLRHVIRQVFPEGTVWLDDPEHPPIHEPVRRDSDSHCRFWVVPSKKGYPRWIIPETFSVGKQGLSFWQPYDRSSQIKWYLIQRLYQCGQLQWLPTIQTVRLRYPDTHGPAWRQLGWEKSIPPVPVIYLGDPYARAKAIVFLIDPEEKFCHDLVKVPLGVSAKQKILHEAAILTQLAKIHPGISSELCFQETERGISGQKAIVHQPTPKQLTQRHLEWLIRLRDPHQHTTLEEESNVLSARFEKAFEAITDVLPGQRALTRQWLEKIKDSALIDSVWIHGDFAPWNLKQASSGQWVGIDWEESVPKGVPFYDLMHFHFIQHYDKPSPKEIFQTKILSDPIAQAYRDYFGINNLLAEKLYAYFLLEYWCRRLEENDTALSHEFFFMEFMP